MMVDGVKPSMAGDIWSHKGCSLMGVTLYGINNKWTIQEWLVSATPFGATRHTGEAIDTVTVESLRRHGLQWRQGGTVYECIHGKVSDNASNMAKGWRINDLRAIQVANNLPQRKPILDVATRWFSSYSMMDWFSEHQQAVQMYDVRHGAEAAKNDAYKANRMQLSDWSVIEQSMAVLKQAAQVTKMLEGTKYVTISLVLPNIHRLIEGTADGPLYMPWKPPALQWLDKRA
jgi:hypothetical protein